MGFQTPKYALSEYLKWTRSGHIQLPDFQREYKWDDERVRQLLVTIVRDHPLGVVMLLDAGNTSVRFKPRSVKGIELPPNTEPGLLLLDGQQRLTSLTQALTGSGVVETSDDRGKNLTRRYYIHLQTALLGDDRIDEAVISTPGDGIERENFGKDIVRDLSSPEKERSQGMFPVRLLFDAAEAINWLVALGDIDLFGRFNAQILARVAAYAIPAIELDTATSKAAVATVFEKVNTGGLPLNVFELLTATFAGDKVYFDQHGEDFRLNDDWAETQKRFKSHPVLADLSSTAFLQTITLLQTLRDNRFDTSGRAPAVSAKREDVLRLELNEYLHWRDVVRDAFVWAATFLADLHIFETRFLPYDSQLVPLAAIRVELGKDAENLAGLKERLHQWYWCGVLGELYGSATESRFARDVEQVPAWARGSADAAVPKTVADANFVESRLHSLRTRGAAAYKGIYALLVAEVRDWMGAQEFGEYHYRTLAVDIHHVFPQKWCMDNRIDDERRESIVNKTPLSAVTNRTIGGVAPASYLAKIEDKAQITSEAVDSALRSHLVDPKALRDNDFDRHFAVRREALAQLVERAIGKEVQRDVKAGDPVENLEAFDIEADAVSEDLDG